MEPFIYCILFLLSGLLSIAERKSMASGAVISIANGHPMKPRLHLAQVGWKAAANTHLLAKMSAAMA